MTGGKFYCMGCQRVLSAVWRSHVAGMCATCQGSQTGRDRVRHLHPEKHPRTPEEREALRSLLRSWHPSTGPQDQEAGKVAHKAAERLQRLSVVHEPEDCTDPVTCNWCGAFDDEPAEEGF
jgi:hypothetical protein